MRKAELKELYQLMFPSYPDILTIRQLQEMLGISRRLSYELINEGKIPAIRIGNSYRIPKIDVINYVVESENGNDPEDENEN